MDWDWRAVWKLERGRIRLLTARTGGGLEALRAWSDRWHPSPGEGMVGRVAVTGCCLRSDDLVGDMVLPRSIHATRAGFRSGIWLPIRRAGRVVGVVEFLGRPA